MSRRRRMAFRSDRVKKWPPSRPPCQYGKFPLDGAVSIDKYLRLWNVFPQNFGFAVSLS